MAPLLSEWKIVQVKREINRVANGLAISGKIELCHGDAFETSLNNKDYIY